MANKGFYIKSVVAKGELVQDSQINFVKGCNVVYGPSDTGKTSLYSVIEFLLGKSSNPKIPLEGTGYTDFLMEIHTYGEEFYTIHRKLNGPSVKVKPCSIMEYYDDSIKYDEYKINAQSANSYSSFLLSLVDVSDIRIKINPSKLHKLTFSTIRHLIFVDETRILNEKSPFYIETNPALYLKCRNILSYLMTGHDDSSYIPEEDLKIRKSRIQGKIDYVTEEIEKKNNKIVEIGDVSYVNLKDSRLLEYYKIEIEKTSLTLSQLYKQKKEISSNLEDLSSEFMFNNEFLERMKLLKEHYRIDLERLEFINEGRNLYKELSFVKCPLCGEFIAKEIMENIESSNFLTAIQNEYISIKSKYNDIDNLITEKEGKIKKLYDEISVIKNKLSNLTCKIDKIEPDLSLLKESLEQAEIIIEKKTTLTNLEDDVRILSVQLSQLKDSLANTKAIHPTENRTDIASDYMNTVKQILSDWKFPDTETISFEYQPTFDFVLSGKGRQLYGKGKRAVSFTAIMIALLDYCYEKSIPFSRLLVIDSPLTAHYDKHQEITQEDQLDNSILNAFFRYCNEKIWNYQFIMFDNKIPENKEFMNNIHIIKFVGKGEDGRNGFYIGK